MIRPLMEKWMKDLSKLLGEIEDIEDVAKESATKEAEKKDGIKS